MSEAKEVKVTPSVDVNINGVSYVAGVEVAVSEDLAKAVKSVAKNSVVEGVEYIAPVVSE